MPAVLSYPGVYVEEVPSGVRTITGVATSITAFVGRAMRGPVDAPTRISVESGAITEAVKEVQSYGLRVISLNQAGSVPDAADLVVSDPVQAGVMAVMAVADTAKFDLMKQLKKKY